MHSRSVYLAAILFSGTQLRIDIISAFANFAWLLISCIVTLVLLPYGQQLVTTTIRQQRRQRHQKVLLAKAVELPNNLASPLQAHVSETKSKLEGTSRTRLNKAFGRIAKLEKRLLLLYSIAERNPQSAEDGSFKRLRRPKRTTMSESNIHASSSTYADDCCPRTVANKWTVLSSGDLRQVPSDLSHFRRRIDESIREQRRTREIVEEAQDKLRHLRQYQAQVEASLTSNSSTPRILTSYDHFTSSPTTNKRRRNWHRSMSSLDEELTSEVFARGINSDNIRDKLLNDEIRPLSSDGRLKSTAAGCDKNVDFAHPPEFDITIAWPFQPINNSTLRNTRSLAPKDELYASHSYRLMLLEDMLASCKLQLETSLRANATANSEIYVTRDKLQKMQDECKATLERAVHFETKYRNLAQLIQPRLYDLRNQTRLLQQRLVDVNLDLGKDMENYKENFGTNVQILQSFIQRTNCGNMRAKVAELSSELSFQERQRRETETENYKRQRENLQLSNKVEQLTEALQSKDTSIAILEQDFHEEKAKTQKLEEQNDKLFQKKSLLQEQNEECTKQLKSLYQEFKSANEKHKQSETKVSRLMSELSQLRSTSEARIEQLTNDLNDSNVALDNERERWYRKQESFREEFKKQTEVLHEKLEITGAELERERNQTFDYKERVEDLQTKLQKSEDHVAELKRRNSFEHTKHIQDLERQLANAQQIALKATNDYRKLEERIKELEEELREYKIQFDRERQDRVKAQNDFDGAKNLLERTEQILNETDTQKQQLLKSVTTFEEENSRLRKVCKELNSQIDVCKKDVDSKYLKVVEQKRTREQEEIKRLKSEIAQMEKKYANREQNLLQRLSETNSSFNHLKEQFERRLNHERDQHTGNPSTTFIPTIPNHHQRDHSSSSTSALPYPTGPSSSIHTSTIVRRTFHTSTSKLGRHI